MSSEIRSLKPNILWNHFADLNEVPRPSKKEERVIAFIKNFGESLGLETIVDKTGNIIIKKPASEGMEDRQTVLLQSHIDMVHQKNSDVQFDFDNDPIQSYIDGEWVKAKGTTLGSDNGIGVAAAMSVLSSKEISHGPIEALFTIDEETGMTGAFGLEPGLLNASIMLNMDSEDEGELYIGCAGGIDTLATINYNEESTPSNHIAFKVFVSGLKGGHSGIDIPLGRGNSNKILNRLLNEVLDDIRIAHLDGGSLRNAIPREAHAIITLDPSKKEEVIGKMETLGAAIKSELNTTEPNLTFTFTSTTLPEKVIDTNSAGRIVRSIYACPNGVIRMSADIEGLVETSTNLARIITENSGFRMESLQRSSVDSAKQDLANMIRSVFELAGANVEHKGAYPGWKPNPHSPILEVMKAIYEKEFGIVPDVKAIHAGLECGIINSKYPNLDCISFGPTIRNPHSPDEMVNIETVEKFWFYLLETLKNIPTQ